MYYFLLNVPRPFCTFCNRGYLYSFLSKYDFLNIFCCYTVLQKLNFGKRFVKLWYFFFPFVPSRFELLEYTFFGHQNVIMYKKFDTKISYFEICKKKVLLLCDDVALCQRAPFLSSKKKLYPCCSRQKRTSCFKIRTSYKSWK